MSGPHGLNEHKITWSTVGLSITVWDYLICLEDERRYIWSRRAPTVSKWMYLAARYLGIATQLIDHTLILLHTSNERSALGCKVWACFEVLLLRVFVGLAETLIMLRVYAFYNQDVFLKWLFIIWSAVELALDGYFLYHSVAIIEFNHHCGVLKTPMPCVGFVVLVLFTQVALIVMIQYRRRIISPRDWKSIPVVYVVVRDSSILCVSTVVLFSAAVPYTIAANQGLIVIPMLNAAYSLAICRMTLNMLSLSKPQTEEPQRQARRTVNTSVVLTSHIITTPFHEFVTPTNEAFQIESTSDADSFSDVESFTDIADHRPNSDHGV